MELKKAFLKFSFDTCPSTDVLEESYQNRKDQLALQELKGLSIDEERTELELAYKTILYEIQQNTSQNALLINSHSQISRTEQMLVNQKQQVGLPIVPIGYTGEFDHIGLPQTITCPHCEAENPIQASYCIICNQQISRPCPKCGAPISLCEYICNRCNTVVKEYDQERYIEINKTKLEVEKARVELENHVKINEISNSRYLGFGIIFWIITVILASGLCGLLIYFFSNRS